MKHTTVTLNAIRKHRPCESSWKELLRHLGKTQADDTAVPLLTILDLLGLDACLWALRVLPPEADSEVRLLVCDLVEPALKYTTDPRPAKTLQVARRYARGQATDAELLAAWASARDARAAGTTAAWVAGDAAALAAQAAGAAQTAALAAQVAQVAAWDSADAVRAEQERIVRAALEGR